MNISNIVNMGIDTYSVCGIIYSIFVAYIMLIFKEDTIVFLALVLKK
ncbi:hypothetical protein QIA23_05020 (plasmid) [Borreliella lanei]